MMPPAVEATQFDRAAADQMTKIISDLSRMYHERNEALQEVARAHHEALLLLAMAAEYRDDDTGLHIVRIGFLAEALALRMGQSRHYAELLRKAAPMHDIGKIGIPDCVLKKPGPLTPAERQVMDRHPVIGADILGKSRTPLFQLAAEIALTHHERWDGTGYPNRLSGEDIPLSGRLVSVVDFYDALTMDRIYRQAYDHEKVMDMLSRQSGKAFDPAIVDCFIHHGDELHAMRLAVKDNGTGFTQLIQNQSGSQQGPPYFQGGNAACPPP